MVKINICLLCRASDQLLPSQQFHHQAGQLRGHVLLGLSHASRAWQQRELRAALALGAQSECGKFWSSRGSWASDFQVFKIDVELKNTGQLFSFSILSRCCLHFENMKVFQEVDGLVKGAILDGFGHVYLHLVPLCCLLRCSPTLCWPWQCWCTYQLWSGVSLLCRPWVQISSS